MASSGSGSAAEAVRQAVLFRLSALGTGSEDLSPSFAARCEADSGHWQNDMQPKSLSFETPNDKVRKSSPVDSLPPADSALQGLKEIGLWGHGVLVGGRFSSGLFVFVCYFWLLFCLSFLAFGIWLAVLTLNAWARMSRPTRWSLTLFHWARNGIGIGILLIRMSIWLTPWRAKFLEKLLFWVVQLLQLIPMTARSSMAQKLRDLFQSRCLCQLLSMRGAAEKASEPKKAEALKESEPQKAAQLQRKPSRDGSVFLSSPEKDDEQPETVFKRPSAHSVKKRPAAADEGVKNVKVLKRPAAAQPPEDEPKEEPKVLKRPAAAQPPEDKPKDEPKEEPKSEVKEKCKESWAYPSADQRFTDKSGKWEVGMGQFKKFFSTFVQGMVSS